MSTHSFPPRRSSYLLVWMGQRPRDEERSHEVAEQRRQRKHEERDHRDYAHEEAADAEIIVKAGANPQDDPTLGVAVEAVRPRPTRLRARRRRAAAFPAIGSASWRERVCQYV